MIIHEVTRLVTPRRGPEFYDELIDKVMEEGLTELYTLITFKDLARQMFGKTQATKVANPFRIAYEADAKFMEGLALAAARGTRKATIETIDRWKKIDDPEFRAQRIAQDVAAATGRNSTAVLEFMKGIVDKYHVTKNTLNPNLMTAIISEVEQFLGIEFQDAFYPDVAER